MNNSPAATDVAAVARRYRAKVRLSHPLASGPRLIDVVEVRIPSPSSNLARPPRGVKPVIWRLTQITDVPVEAMQHVNVDDAEAIVDAHERLCAEFRADVAGVRETLRG